MRLFFKSKLFKLPYLRNFDGIVIGRFCFLKAPKDPKNANQLILIGHELIHQRQMDEHGIFKFYAIYLKDFLKNLIKYKDAQKAYYLIPFEIEAYEQQFAGLVALIEKKGVIVEQ